jgi:hypothetical protein
MNHSVGYSRNDNSGSNFICTNGISFISHTQTSQSIGTSHHPRVSHEKRHNCMGCIHSRNDFLQDQNMLRMRNPDNQVSDENHIPNLFRTIEITYHNNGLRIFFIYEATIGGKEGLSPPCRDKGSTFDCPPRFVPFRD